MHVSNEADFGHLVNPESFDTSRTHPDVYQVMDNKLEWENRYLHPEYKDNFIEGNKFSMVIITFRFLNNVTVLSVCFLIGN